MYLDVIAYRISTVQTFIYILVLLFTCHIHSSNLFWVQLCAKHASRCCGYHIECDSSSLYTHGVYILVPWTGWLSFLHFPFHLRNSGGHKNQLNTICAFKYFTNSGGNRQWKQIQWRHESFPLKYKMIYGWINFRLLKDKGQYLGKFYLKILHTISINSMGVYLLNKTYKVEN